MSLSAIRPELARVLVGQIDEPRLISRNAVDEAHVEELAASIRAQGFTSTIVLARVDERYEVVAGHHRLLAARRVGLVDVPALVYPSYVDGIQAIQASENELQKPTTPCDQAIWYAQLLEQRPEQGTDGVAALVGEKRDFVEARLSLLYGDRQIFDALGADQIRIGVAQQLNRVTDERHRRYLLDLAIRGGATVGLVAQWVHEWKTIHAPATASGEPVPIVNSAGPVSAPEYFRCVACERTEDVARMQPLQIHDYCIRATLQPALRAFQNRGDFVEWPRTREQAEALIARVIERFPELVPS